MKARAYGGGYLGMVPPPYQRAHVVGMPALHPGYSLLGFRVQRTPCVGILPNSFNRHRPLTGMGAMVRSLSIHRGQAIQCAVDSKKK